MTSHRGGPDRHNVGVVPGALTQAESLRPMRQSGSVGERAPMSPADGGFGWSPVETDPVLIRPLPPTSPVD